MKKISEMYGMKVFTASGDFFGNVDELIVVKSSILSWKIISTKNSILSRFIGDAKGVIVPHSLIKGIGDIIIIHNNAVPQPDSEDNF